MARAEQMCQDCRKDKVNAALCTGDYDWHKGEKCDRCKRSKRKKCSLRGPPASEPRPASLLPVPVPAELVPLAPRAQLRHPQEPFLPSHSAPTSLYLRASSTDLASSVVAENVSPVLRWSQPATQRAPPGRNVVSEPGLLQSLETHQTRGQLHAFIQRSLDAMTLSSPVHPPQTASNDQQRFEMNRQIFQRVSDKIKSQLLNTPLDYASIPDDAVHTQYFDILVDAVPRGPASVSTIYSHVPAPLFSQPHAAQATFLWRLIKQFDEQGAPCASDCLCIKLSQLGITPVMGHLEEELWEKRLQRALARTAERINTEWGELCEYALELGPVCHLTQLFEFYHIDWLRDRLGFSVEPDTILDNFLWRTRAHMGCKYLHCPSNHQFWRDHNQHLEARDVLLMTPLHVAASCGCLECVKALLERGVRSYLIDIFGRTALVIASAAGHDKVVVHLAKLDQPKRKLFPLEQHPVVAAAAKGQYSTILILKALGYSLNTEQDGMLPSQVARQNGYSEVADSLATLEAPASQGREGSVSPDGLTRTRTFAFLPNS